MVKELTNCDSILQGPIIEEIGGGLTEGGVHTILDLEADGTDTKHYQTLKQGLGQTSTIKHDQFSKETLCIVWWEK